MKQILYAFSVLTLLSCHKKDPASFIVNGAINNQGSVIIYLEEDIPGNPQPIIVDSVMPGRDKKFSLSAPVKEETMFSLRSGRSAFPFALLINDTKRVTVTADLSNKSDPYTISGSPASKQILEYDKNLSSMAQFIVQKTKEIDSLKKAKANDSLINIAFGEYMQSITSMKNYTTEFVTKSSSPVLTLYVLGAYQRMSNDLGIKGYTDMEMAGIINQAAIKFPNHRALADVRNKLKPKKAMDFIQPDSNGHPVALSSFKGKYVLIDFWASWCAPCRQENLNVVKAYNMFRNRNFSILGVSLDQSRNAWLKAIKDDGLSWTEVSDLKFWNNEAASLYNVSSIPYNFLVDPNGDIIAEDIRGNDLINLLNSVLK